jgi:hypothetical protein
MKGLRRDIGALAALSAMLIAMPSVAGGAVAPVRVRLMRRRRALFVRADDVRLLQHSHRKAAVSPCRREHDHRPRLADAHPPDLPTVNGTGADLVRTLRGLAGTWRHLSGAVRIGPQPTSGTGSIRRQFARKHPRYRVLLFVRRASARDLPAEPSPPNVHRAERAGWMRVDGARTPPSLLRDPQARLWAATFPSKPPASGGHRR